MCEHIYNNINVKKKISIKKKMEREYGGREGRRKQKREGEGENEKIH